MRVCPSDTGSLDITWVNCGELTDAPTIGVGGLPGMKFKNSWRDLENDISTLKDAGFSDVFCLCKTSELKFFRVRELLETYKAQGIIVHHYPIEFGMAPGMREMKALLEDLRMTIFKGNKVYIHGISALGRVSVVVAALLLELQENLTAAEAMNNIKMLVGAGAFQTMRQYNFIDEFKEELKASPDR